MLKKIPAPELGKDADHYVPKHWVPPKPTPSDEDLTSFRDAFTRLANGLHERDLARQLMDQIHASGASNLPRIALKNRVEYPSPIDNNYAVDEQIAMTWLLHSLVLTPRRPGADPVGFLIDLVRRARDE